MVAVKPFYANDYFGVINLKLHLQLPRFGQENPRGLWYCGCVIGDITIDSGRTG